MTLRALAPFPEVPDSILSTHMVLNIFVTPVPGDLIILYRHEHHMQSLRGRTIIHI